MDAPIWLQNCEWATGYGVDVPAQDYRALFAILNYFAPFAHHWIDTHYVMHPANRRIAARIARVYGTSGVSWHALDPETYRGLADLIAVWTRLVGLFPALRGPSR